MQKRAGPLVIAGHNRFFVQSGQIIIVVVVVAQVILLLVQRVLSLRLRVMEASSLRPKQLLCPVLKLGFEPRERVNSRVKRLLLGI